MKLILAVLIGVLRSRAAITVENALIRHQLAVLQRSSERPALRRRDRLLWMLVGKLWGKRKTAFIIVQPDTVVRWHREGFRLFWRWKPRGGRPKLQSDIRLLARRMAEDNLL